MTATPPGEPRGTSRPVPEPIVPRDEASAADVLAQARALLSSTSVDAVAAALSQVARLREPAASALLSEFASAHPSPYLRQKAVECVARYRTPGGVEVLAAALRSASQPEVRRAAARGLENWGRPTAARAALAQAAADDPDVAVRAIAARVLEALG